jgi:hypothetical protein
MLLDESPIPSDRKEAIRTLVVQDLIAFDELSIPSGRMMKID